MKAKNTSIIALVTVVILSIPIFGRFPWTLSDFVVMGSLIFGTGLLIDIANTRAGKNRVAAIIGIIFLFLWLWAELAVGVFTNWGS